MDDKLNAVKQNTHILASYTPPGGHIPKEGGRGTSFGYKKTQS